MVKINDFIKIWWCSMTITKFGNKTWDLRTKQSERKLDSFARFLLWRSIVNWVNTNGLSLNPIKTQFMIFGTPPKLSSITEPMCLKLENHSITQVSTYKYLGVYLDPSLKWKDHIYHSSKKIGSRLALLSRLKRTLPLQSLKLLANSLVLPLFDYCSVAWFAMS